MSKLWSSKIIHTSNDRLAPLAARVFSNGSITRDRIDGFDLDLVKAPLKESREEDLALRIPGARVATESLQVAEANPEMKGAQSL